MDIRKNDDRDTSVRLYARHLATQNVGKRGGCRLCTVFGGRLVRGTVVVVVEEEEEGFSLGALIARG
jgi:hypothetical protein